MAAGRVFYCGMVNTDQFGAAIGQPVFVGAASRKMTSLVLAMRRLGVAAWMVSMPVLGTKSTIRFASGRSIFRGGAPVIFLPTWANRYFRKISSLIVFGVFCTLRVRRSDTVILYNHAFEYLLGLAILRLRGFWPYMDIEDSPRRDRRGLGAALDYLIFYFTLRLTRPNKITVSQTVVREIGLQDALVIYGVASELAGVRNWVESVDDTGVPLRIHFGGSLLQETGLQLFCDAVRILSLKILDRPYRVIFVVTGFGGESEIALLAGEIADTGVLLEERRHLSSGDYLEVLRRCHVGLSLRVPDSSYSTTTFPSKVVEITSEGLLLVTTRVSDIPLLFSDEEAVILRSADPTELADCLFDLIRDRSNIASIAQRGRSKAQALFSADLVGRRLLCHLDILASEDSVDGS